MKFEYLRLKNYRQYQNAQINFLPFDSKKNFIIIMGTTGSGKTNIMNAVTWCLYGIEYNIRDKDRGLPLLNLVTFDKMEEGDTSEVSVEIQMRGEQDERITFKRTLQFMKRNGKPLSIPDYNAKAKDGSSFYMFLQKGKDTVPIHSPEYRLNQLIPQSIEEYFFFDGERLDDYFQETSKVAIKEAVFKISQIGLLENLIKHLDERKNDYTRKSNKLSSQAIQVNQSLQRLKTSWERTEGEYTKLVSQRNVAKKRFEEISESLRNTSNINLTNLEEQRKGLEIEIKEVDQSLSIKEQEKFQFIAKAAPTILMYEPLTKLLELINNTEESGRIPPEYQKSFLKKLLKNGKCICGIDFYKETENRQKIEQLLTEHDDISELSSMLIRLEGTLNIIQNTYQQFDEVKRKLNDEIRILQKQHERISKGIKQIEESIGSIDQDAIRRLEASRQEWSKKLETLNNDLGRKKYEVEGYQKKVNAEETRLDKELRKDKRSEELVAIRDFCNNALTIAETIKKEIMSEILKDIAKKTKEQFFSLIWKTSDYKDVTIDETYNVSVKHQSGFEGIGTLSAGEGIVLALSFMAAINSVSGFDVPIMIDTPLGRLAGEPREKIAKNLPKYLPGKQVIMLVTDTEYTETVRNLLSKRVGKTYKIEFSEKGVGATAEVTPIE